jgi:hypothetical protein
MGQNTCQRKGRQVEEVAFIEEQGSGRERGRDDQVAGVTAAVCVQG